jgi:hypothetical protein
MRFRDALLSILLLLVCTSSAKTLAAEQRDLIVVAGQSNAVGFNANPSELPTDAVDNDILFWWRAGDPPPDEHDSTSGGEWTHLQPQPRGNPLPPIQGGVQFGNFASPNGGFGPEIGLARTLYAKGDKHLAVVKAAVFATAVLALQSGIGAIRQIELLGMIRHRLKFLHSLAVWFAGVFLGQVLITFIAGDVVRAIQFSRHTAEEVPEVSRQGSTLKLQTNWDRRFLEPPFCLRSVHKAGSTLQ